MISGASSASRRMRLTQLFPRSPLPQGTARATRILNNDSRILSG